MSRSRGTRNADAQGRRLLASAPERRRECARRPPRLGPRRPPYIVSPDARPPDKWDGVVLKVLAPAPYSHRRSAGIGRAERPAPPHQSSSLHRPPPVALRSESCSPSIGRHSRPAVIRAQHLATRRPLHAIRPTPAAIPVQRRANRSLRRAIRRHPRASKETRAVPRARRRIRPPRRARRIRFRQSRAARPAKGAQIVAPRSLRRGLPCRRRASDRVGPRDPATRQAVRVATSPSCSIASPVHLSSLRGGTSSSAYGNRRPRCRRWIGWSARPPR